MKFLLPVFLVIFANKALSEDFRARAHKIATNSEYSTSDIKAEVEFGRGLAARILSNYKLVENPQLQNYINTLGSGLAAMIGRPELTFYFAVIDTPDVNAYACPGGYIFLTKGLISSLENEAELVGVLAHEIGHVNERHVIKKLKIKGKDDSAAAGLGAMIGGATASFRVALQTITQEAMNILFNEGLMESDELQSDRVAISAMFAVGYDIKAYETLLEKVRQSLMQNKAQVLAKTHPSVDDRMKLVKIFEKKNSSYNGIDNASRFKKYTKL